MNSSRRRWLRIIGNFLGLVITGAALIFVLWIASGFIFLEENYRAAQAEAGSMKVMIAEFRDFYSQRDKYPSKSLKELHADGVLSDDTFAFITDGFHRFRPFSSDTPDNEFVLRLGPPFIGHIFHKGDLVAPRGSPDIVVRQ